jgi:hypothetical protein
MRSKVIAMLFVLGTLSTVSQAQIQHVQMRVEGMT